MGRRPSTFYFYDLETSGIRPRTDRIMQFAGQRTDENLQVIGDELCLEVALGDEVVPNPESILVTGITPQRTRADGIEEWRAIAEIDAKFRQPGTCVVGYNNLRFDDEFIRHTLYRNLFDPYAREWRDGNSRWDMVDLVRAAGALRPDGVNWPRADERPSFRLEALTEANGLSHESAHDAMSDVHATVQVAQMLRQQQPKLFDYYLDHCNKADVRRQLIPLGKNLLVHVSGMISNQRDCCAPFMSVAEHPQNSNSVIGIDLGGDLRVLLDHTASELRESLFSRNADGSSAARPPLKEVRLNRSPFIAPIAVVRPQDADRLGWDLAKVREDWRSMQQQLDKLSGKIAEVYAPGEAAGMFERTADDPDEALYDGFISDRDRTAADKFQQVVRGFLSGAPDDNSARWPSDMTFEDSRLEVLAGRLKARLAPAQLSTVERDAWRSYVAERLTEEHPQRLTLAAFREVVDARLAVVPIEDGDRRILRELLAYGDEMARRLA